MTIENVLNLRRSTYVNGVYCSDFKSHYPIGEEAPETNEITAEKGRLTINYCFYQRKWKEDLAYVMPDTLGQIIAFADKSGISVHDSYRALLV